MKQIVHISKIQNGFGDSPSFSLGGRGGGALDKSIKVLVVEDSEFQREIVIFQLKDQGFEEVVGKEDGSEALSYLQENPVGLIISDWEMPNLNGLELLKKVKENPSLQNIPFIILTISDDESKISEALKAGAVDYLVKPAPGDLLLEKIEKIFG